MSTCGRQTLHNHDSDEPSVEPLVYLTLEVEHLTRPRPSIPLLQKCTRSVGNRSRAQAHNYWDARAVVSALTVLKPPKSLSRSNRPVSSERAYSTLSTSLLDLGSGSWSSWLRCAILPLLRFIFGDYAEMLLSSFAERVTVLRNRKRR